MQRCLSRSVAATAATNQNNNVTKNVASRPGSPMPPQFQFRNNNNNNKSTTSSRAASVSSTHTSGNASRAGSVSSVRSEVVATAPRANNNSLKPPQQQQQQQQQKQEVRGRVPSSKTSSQSQQNEQRNNNKQQQQLIQDALDFDSASSRQTPYPLHLKSKKGINNPPQEFLKDGYDEESQEVEQSPASRHRHLPMKQESANKMNSALVDLSFVNNSASDSSFVNREDESVSETVQVDDCDSDDAPSFASKNQQNRRRSQKQQDMNDLLSPLGNSGHVVAEKIRNDNNHNNNDRKENKQGSSSSSASQAHVAVNSRSHASRSQPARPLDVPQKHQRQSSSSSSGNKKGDHQQFEQADEEYEDHDDFLDGNYCVEEYRFAPRRHIEDEEGDDDHDDHDGEDGNDDDIHDHRRDARNLQMKQIGRTSGGGATAGTPSPIPQNNTTIKNHNVNKQSKIAVSIGSKPQQCQSLSQSANRKFYSKSLPLQTCSKNPVQEQQLREDSSPSSASFLVDQHDNIIPNNFENGSNFNNNNDDDDDDDDCGDSDVAVALKEAHFCGQELTTMVANFVKRQSHYVKRLGRRGTAQKRRYDQTLEQMEHDFQRSELAVQTACEQRVRSLDQVCASLRDDAAEKSGKIQILETELVTTKETLSATAKQLLTAQRDLGECREKLKEAVESADAAERIAQDLHEQLIKEQDRYLELQRQVVQSNGALVCSSASSSASSSIYHQQSSLAANASQQQQPQQPQRTALSNVSNATNTSAGAGVVGRGASLSSTNSAGSQPHHQYQHHHQQQQQQQPHQRSFVLTGFSHAQKDSLTKAIQQLGGTLVSCAPDQPLPSSVTHVVAGSHTAKSVAGMLMMNTTPNNNNDHNNNNNNNNSSNNCCWVVPAAFIFQSLTKQQWIDESAVGGIKSDLVKWKRLFPVVIIPKQRDRDGGAEEVCRLLSAHGFTLVEESESMPEATKSSRQLSTLYQQMRPAFLDVVAE